MGDYSEEFGPAKWWNPYNIDINDFILIHPKTGRKILETNAIASLKTQIEAPSYLEGGSNFTNYPLRECLEKNNQLIQLQVHVREYYEKLFKAWNN